jgi:hypothetical protein
MKSIELQLAELRLRVERLEQEVQRLAGWKPEVPPPPPGEPPDPERVIAWLKAQGLVREPTPEELRLAAEWDSLPEKEKEAHIRFMHSLTLNPPLSQIIIENRR